MSRYLIAFLMATIMEVGSTLYITSCSNNSPIMIFWAFIGPFLSLPFVGFIVDCKDWTSRLKFALSSGIGYGLGALIVYSFNSLCK